MIRHQGFAPQPSTALICVNRLGALFRLLASCRNRVVTVECRDRSYPYHPGLGGPDKGSFFCSDHNRRAKRGGMTGMQSSLLREMTGALCLRSRGAWNWDMAFSKWATATSVKLPELRGSI